MELHSSACVRWWDEEKKNGVRKEKRINTKISLKKEGDWSIIRMVVQTKVERLGLCPEKWESFSHLILISKSGKDNIRKR